MRQGRWLILGLGLLLLRAVSWAAPADAVAPDPLWRDAAASSPMALRAETSNLNLYGGIPLYGDMFRGCEPSDHSTTNPFHDRAAWTERLERMKQLRMNALILVHPHPYELFIDYKDHYPEATWLTGEELAAKREQLRWIIAAAAERGIKLYFLTWNIWLPRGFAQAHGIKQEAEDTPLTREFTRWSVAEFFRTYPGFGGLVTMAAETPPGCSGFVADAIAGGMKEVTPRPRLIFWNWCSYPWQAREVLGAYDGPKMALSYLQYETFFYPKADPRIGATSRDLGQGEPGGAMPMVALGGPKSQCDYLFFGHPGFIHDIVHDLYANNNGRGLLVENVESPERWLAREVFSRTLWNPEEPLDETFWRGRVAGRYGSDALAGPLLTAMEESSLVIPTQLKLTHSQSDHFALQFGLTLAQTLEMPTMSTYIFENETRVRPDGYLQTNMGLDRPNPDWGERVLPIRQWVLGQISDEARRLDRLGAWLAENRRLGYGATPARGDERTPEAVIAELEAHARAARTAWGAALGLAAGATTRTAELGRILNQMELNINLGDSLAAKDRAAISWERFRLSGRPEDATACLAQLDAALTTWRAYADAGDRFYQGQPLTFWQSQMSYAPPWGQLELWQGYAQQRQRISELTPLWEAERQAIAGRIEAARAMPEAERERVTLPIIDELRRPAPGGTAVARFDFEPPADGRFALEPAGPARVALTEDPALVIGGKRSLLVDTRGTTTTWLIYFHTVPGQVKLAPKTRYQVMLRYRVIDGGGLDNRPPFAMALRRANGEVMDDVGDSRLFGGAAGVTSARVLFATTLDHPDYGLSLSIHGAAALVVDDVVIEQVP